MKAIQNITNILVTKKQITMKKNHWLWMVIGCGLPLLFIFLAPSFGIGGSSSLFIFIIFMFGIHLFMPHGSYSHGGHNHSQHKLDSQNNKGHDHNQKEPKEKVLEKHKGDQHH